MQFKGLCKSQGNKAIKFKSFNCCLSNFSSFGFFRKDSMLINGISWIPFIANLFCPGNAAIQQVVMVNQSAHKQQFSILRKPWYGEDWCKPSVFDDSSIILANLMPFSVLLLNRSDHGRKFSFIVARMFDITCP